MLSNKINALIDGDDIELIIVGDIESGNIQFFGSSEKLPSKTLINILFGDKEAIVGLSQSLEGQLLPSVWAQGDVSCMVSKPNEGLVVGTFYVNTRDAIEEYHWNEEMDSKIIDICNNFN